MRFSIYKASSGNSSNRFFGTIEASCIEVAGDLLYKVLRRTKGRKDGDVFIIVPYAETPSIDSLLEEGTPFHIVQYREVE
ncbi:hypothetical protein [Neobacillus notoginsengisoli]|nr:hypothetical protein [Neobacillus notoginsengisoli]